MRDLDPNIVAAADEMEGSFAVDFVRIIVDEDIDGGVLNITSAFREVTFDDNTYIPMGDLLAISVLQHTRDVRTTPVGITLSGLDDTAIAAINSSPIFGSKVILYRGMWDNSTNEVVGTPYERWSGIIVAHSTDIEERGTTTIQLVCKSLLEALLGTTSGRFTSVESFQLANSSDMSMEFVASLSNWTPNFGQET